MNVPSPTFMIENLYEPKSGPKIHHLDLYRIQGPEQLPSPLLNNGILLFLLYSCFFYFFGLLEINLVEWAERLGEKNYWHCLPNLVMITFTAEDESSIADADFDIVRKHHAHVQLFSETYDEVLADLDALFKENIIKH